MEIGSTKAWGMFKTTSVYSAVILFPYDVNKHNSWYRYVGEIC